MDSYYYYDQLFMGSTHTSTHFEELIINYNFLNILSI